MKDFKTLLEERKAESTLQILFKVARLLNDQAIEAFNEKREGQERYRPRHMSLVPHLSLDGSRITTLAEQMQISKQAVGQIVEELEQMGVVHRVPDPSDGRAKLVKFTESGRQSMLNGLDLLGQIEERLAGVVGAHKMQELRTTLTKILAHVDP